MSLFNTLNTGITGLGANGLGLSVSGDNIANLNTVGYKGSSAEFQDLIMQNLGGGKGQLGMGAFTGRVRQGFGQGSIETTANAADLAIDGKGFFVVEDADGGSFYSRAGQFTMDPTGSLVSLQGLKLQGYTASADGTLSTTVGDLVVPTDPVAGTATDSVAVTANLTADPNLVGGPGLVSPADFDAISTGADFTSSSVVYDSLGVAHDVTMAWTKSTTTNQWQFTAWADAGETGGTAGTPVKISEGTLVFATDGSVDATLSTAPAATAITFTGAAAQSIDFDFGLATGDLGGITQRGTASSSVGDIDPNGNASGTLATFDIGQDGIVTGIYSNGETRSLGQVVLATFRGENFLTRAGHNTWQQSGESGEPVIGTPGQGGRGVTHSYALEMSNVDLEKQFVKMIQSQKGYQASTRVISAADDMLQELMQTV
jgi:flagellar hook protein FlgE